MPRKNDLARVLSEAINYLARACAPNEPVHFLALALARDPRQACLVYDLLSPVAQQTSQQARLVALTRPVRGFGIFALLSVHFLFLRFPSIS